MPNVSANGIDIEYVTDGDPSGIPFLLVMGFTAQLIRWPSELVQMLVDRGLYVIRFDNRDCGLSTHFDGVDSHLGELQRAMAARTVRPEVPYKLSDMAADAAGLLDALGIDKAHIAGASMGGMIVQAMAIEHPERVSSLTSIMSSTGERDYGQADPEAMAALTTPPPREREAFIEHSVRSSRVYCSRTHWAVEEPRVRDLAARSFDRCFYPEGYARQLAAITASGNRAAALRELRVPTLVIHGDEDTLIRPDGGERTAELIPGAELLIVRGMGHDLPGPLWTTLADAISRHVHAAEARTAPAA